MWNQLYKIVGWKVGNLVTNVLEALAYFIWKIFRWKYNSRCLRRKKWEKRSSQSQRYTITYFKKDILNAWMIKRCIHGKLYRLKRELGRSSRGQEKMVQQKQNDTRTRCMHRKPGIQNFSKHCLSEFEHKALEYSAATSRQGSQT